MPRYVVLRDMQGSAIGNPFENVRGGFPSAAARGFDPPEPRVEVEDVDARGRAELLRDPTVAALAPTMPTHLIAALAEPETVPAEATPVWGIAAVGADTSPFTGAGTAVAVLDTGIDTTHPAFTGVELVERDFTGDGNGDAHGHGTHCAGTILGRDVDGKRIGVARGVPKALIGKVLGAGGNGDSNMLFSGIQWAVDNGANVISMSLGFDFPGMVQRLVDDGIPADLATSMALEAYRGNLRVFDKLFDLIRAREAFGAGVVLVAASGNESKREIDPRYEIAASLPAAADGMISVGALGESSGGLVIAPFSNTFPVIAGPGVGIVSARAGGGLSTKSGTSMACPHVAGVAALWWEAIRGRGIPATSANVVANLRASARTAGLAPGLDIEDRGVGLVTAPTT